MFHSIRQAFSFMSSEQRARWLSLIPLALIAAILEMASVLGVYYLIRLITNSELKIELPIALPAQFQDAGFITMILCIGLSILYFIKNGLRLWETYLREKYAQQSSVTIAAKLFSYYLNAPYTLHHKRNSADLIRNIQNASITVSKSILATATAACTEILIALGIISVLMFSAPAITLLAGLSIGVMMGLILLFTHKYHSLWGAKSYHLTKDTLQSLQQGLEGIKEIKVLGKEGFFLKNYTQKRGELAQLETYRGTFSMVPRLAVETVFVISIMLLILSNQLWNFSSELVPLLGLLTYAGFRLLPSFHWIVYYVNTIKFAGTAVDNIFSDWQELEQHETRTSKADKAQSVLTGNIEFCNISYRYENSEQDALGDINIHIKYGETIGVVGASGAGKSTFVDLLLGLIKPDSGCIKVDGKTLNADSEQWRKQIGYVPQTIYLLDDSIAKNIALGLNQEEISELKLKRAIDQAQLTDLISSLPEGVQTVVGERGIRLSGGQRQRIAIARALYNNPKILLLDEATASLDYQTEQAITESIKALHGQKTVILVAHRLRTVRSCDKILFFSAGSILETGDFGELSDRCEDFRRIALLE